MINVFKQYKYESDNILVKWGRDEYYVYDKNTNVGGYLLLGFITTKAPMCSKPFYYYKWNKIKYNKRQTRKDIRKAINHIRQIRWWKPLPNFKEVIK